MTVCTRPRRNMGTEVAYTTYFRSRSGSFAKAVRKQSTSHMVSVGPSCSKCILHECLANLARVLCSWTIVCKLRDWRSQLSRFTCSKSSKVPLRPRLVRKVSKQQVRSLIVVRVMFYLSRRLCGKARIVRNGFHMI